MDIRTLKYFLAVAREQNISKAANDVHTTQPNLTRQIQGLESELGKPLFYKQNHKMILTDDGRLLRKRAEEIVALFDKTEAEMMRSETDVSGTIAIGGGETRSNLIVAETLKKIRKEHPLIKIDFFSGDTDEVVEKLEKGLIDFGLLFEPFDTQRYNYIRIPEPDRLGILCPRNTEIGQMESVKREDLWDKPIIISRHNEKNYNLFDWFGKTEEELNVVGRYNLIYNAVMMVRADLGYAIAIDRLVHTSGESSLAFVPFDPPCEMNISLVYKKYQIPSKISEIFLEAFKETIKEYQEKESTDTQK